MVRDQRVEDQRRRRRPFIESKESVGGFSIIDVPDRDAAIALAKTWPGHAIEIREIVEQRPR
jgi:hypothetical protein